MFCPQCGAEYRPGFNRCKDCDIDLVEHLPSEREPSAEVDHPDLVVLRTYATVIDAQLAKTVLESVGIDSMVRSDNEGGQNPFLASTLGVELLVRANDVAAATDVLGVEGIEDGGHDPNARREDS